jgi:hypothetical protein
MDSFEEMFEERIFVESSEDLGLLFNRYKSFPNYIMEFLLYIENSINSLLKCPKTDLPKELINHLKKFKSDVTISKKPERIDISEVSLNIKTIKNFRNKIDPLINKLAKLKSQIAFGGNLSRSIIRKPKVYSKSIDEEKYSKINTNIRNINRSLDWVEKIIIDLFNMIDQDLNILHVVKKVYVKNKIYESLDNQDNNFDIQTNVELIEESLEGIESLIKNIGITESVSLESMINMIPRKMDIRQYNLYDKDCDHMSSYPLFIIGTNMMLPISYDWKDNVGETIISDINASTTDIGNIIRNLENRFKINFFYINDESLSRARSEFDNRSVSLSNMNEKRYRSYFPDQTNRQLLDSKTAAIVNIPHIYKTRNVTSLDELELIISHDYGHLRTWDKLSKEDISEYILKRLLIHGLYSIYFGDGNILAQYAYYHLKPEVLANECGGITPLDMISARYNISSVPGWNGSVYKKIVDMKVPANIIKIMTNMTMKRSNPVKKYITDCIEYSRNVYREILPKRIYKDVFKELNKVEENITNVQIKTNSFDILMERSHRSLNTSYRIVVDDTNGHIIKLIFDLNVDDVDRIGTHMLQRDLDVTQEERDKIKRGIRKTGHNDFSSKGTVRAIIDLDTGKNLKSVKAGGLMNHYYTNTLDFITDEQYTHFANKYGELFTRVDRFAKLKTDVRELIAKSPQWNPPDSKAYTTTEREINPSYKATKAPKSIKKDPYPLGSLVKDLVQNMDAGIRPNKNTRGIGSINNPNHENYQSFIIPKFQHHYDKIKNRIMNHIKLIPVVNVGTGKDLIIKDYMNEANKKFNGMINIYRKAFRIYRNEDSNEKEKKAKDMMNQIAKDLQQILVNLTIIERKQLEIIKNNNLKESVEEYGYESTDLNELLDDIDSPEELLSYLKDNNFKYGFISSKDGSTVNVEGNADENNKKFATEYALQTPDELLESKHGVCWDYAELERTWFKSHWNEDFNVYYIISYETKAQPTHSFLIFEHDEKTCWFEYSWDKYRGIHQYDSTNDALNDIKSKFMKYSELKNENQCCIFILKKVPKKHMTCVEYMDWAETNEEIIESVLFNEGWKDTLKSVGGAIKKGAQKASNILKLNKSLRNLQMMDLPRNLFKTTPLVNIITGEPLFESYGEYNISTLYENLSYNDLRKFCDEFAKKKNIAVIVYDEKFPKELLTSLFCSGRQDVQNALFTIVSKDFYKKILSNKVKASDKSSFSDKMDEYLIADIESRSHMSDLEKIIIVSNGTLTEYTLNNYRAFEAMLLHEYGHAMTFDKISIEDWEWYQNKIVALGSIMSYFTRTLGIKDADLVSEYLVKGYWQLKPEKLANEYSNVNISDFLMASGLKLPTGKYSDIKFNEVIHYKVPKNPFKDELEKLNLSCNRDNRKNWDELNKKYHLMNCDINLNYFKSIIPDRYMGKMIEIIKENKERIMKDL